MDHQHGSLQGCLHSWEILTLKLSLISPTATTPWTRNSLMPSGLSIYSFIVQSKDSQQNKSFISSEGKDFIQKLLVVDPDKRMTASECLEHSWILDTEDNTSRFELLVDGSQTILTFSSGSLLPSSGGANTPTRSGRSTGSGPGGNYSEISCMFNPTFFFKLKNVLT